MDVVMPGQSGIEGVPLVLKEAPDAKVLVLSMQDDPRYVHEAFAAGAAGYILKEAVDAEVVGAIQRVAAGDHYVHPALGARLIAAEAEAKAREEADPLSDREREVMRLLALGHTNQEIAKMLFISVRTAETHRAHIMQKLRLSTRAELVRYAIDQGLLEEPSLASRPVAVLALPVQLGEHRDDARNALDELGNELGLRLRLHLAGQPHLAGVDLDLDHVRLDPQRPPDHVLADLLLDRRVRDGRMPARGRRG